MDIFDHNEALGDIAYRISQMIETYPDFRTEI